MNYFLSGGWYWVVATVGVAVTTLLAIVVARWSWRWSIGLCVAAASVVFLLVLPARYPAHAFLDESTPALFANFFWTWVLVLTLGALFSTVSLIRTMVRRQPAAEDPTAVAADRVPEIETAWKEIQLRLSHAQIDLGSQHVYLILTPQEEWASAVIHAAGLPLFVQAPDGDAPIHAFATADGVFLSLAGASAFGTQADDGPRRMETLCRLILAERPDCPVIRGTVVLFPITWAGHPDSVKWAAAVRDDLRVIERILKLRCPVYALFPEMETTPGFLEFLARMSAPLRQSRCGFAVPASQAFTGEMIQNGLVWMSGWFHGWILNLMADDLLNQAGNNQLFSLDYEFRRYRRRLRAVLEAAFSTHRETEPVLFRGCYFLASGADTREQAFSAGLLRGPRGRILADHSVTQWTRQAREDDRFYRRTALVVGLVGAGLALLTWSSILIMSSGPLRWAGPVVVVLVWSVVLLRISRWK